MDKKKEDVTDSAMVPRHTGGSIYGFGWERLIKQKGFIDIKVLILIVVLILIFLMFFL